jgi:hypothetical protein
VFNLACRFLWQERRSDHHGLDGQVSRDVHAPGQDDQRDLQADESVAQHTPRGITGKPAARALHEAGIECNYNTIPFDPRKPFDPSGLRIGTPSITSRGMKEKDMEPIAAWIDRVLTSADDTNKLHKIRAEIAEFCKAFPAPGIRV